MPAHTIFLQSLAKNFLLLDKKKEALERFTIAGIVCSNSVL